MCIDIGRYDAVTFDCYGTLIDWDTGVSNFFGPWTARHGVDRRCAGMIADFAETQRAHQHHRPCKNYRAVIREAFRDAASSMWPIAGSTTLRRDGSSASTLSGSTGGTGGGAAALQLNPTQNPNGAIGASRISALRWSTPNLDPVPLDRRH